MEHNIPELVAQLTLEEKAGLCSGADFWHTKTVERLGIPTLMVSDGPHGLRTQDPEQDDPNHSRKAVCFPAGCSAAASFDPDLARREGAAIGREARAFGVGVVLGPAVNIKRSPLCGRNFEYYSEDPVLAGELAAGYINGVQSQGVGTSIKHFAANSQEYRRMSASSDMTERTLREIYLPAFETAVKKSQPWTVMCSYNRVNDVFASESRMLLTDILRTEWNFKGFVMSDWGAVADRVKGVAAGLDLEMPGSGGVNDAKIVAAVKAGTLSEAALDKAVIRILNIVFRAADEAAVAPAAGIRVVRPERRPHHRRRAGQGMRRAFAEPRCAAAEKGQQGSIHWRLCQNAALSGRRLQPHQHHQGGQRAGNGRKPWPPGELCGGLPR